MNTTKGWVRLFSLGVLVLAISATSTAKEMYRWVDANGQVHYSDRPPPAGAKNIRTLKESATGTVLPDESTDSAPSYIEQEAAFKERQVKRAEEQAEAEKTKLAAAERKKNCELARSNYNTISVGGRITRVNSAGEREYLSDEEVAQETAAARAAMEQWCNE
ncbi:MAG: DUF4124 domain-containing protein [Burkholderiales bacterium]|nr:DUF4124 domain-containing protein [Burkholderiales bacterium]